MLLLTIGLTALAAGSALAGIGKWIYERGVADGLEQAARAEERARIAALERKVSES